MELIIYSSRVKKILQKKGGSTFGVEADGFGLWNAMKSGVFSKKNSKSEKIADVFSFP